MPDIDDALNLAYQILSRRAFSEKALRERLKKKGLEDRMIETVIEKLKEQKLVSDSVLAQNLAESRVQNRLWGDYRIEMDLIKKGLPKDEVKTALKNASESEDAVSEEERAYLLILRRMKQIKADDENSFDRKLFGFLARRGFDPDTIHSALERYRRETK